MDKKIIHMEKTRRYVNGILVVLVLCYLYIFIFHSFSFIFWSVALVLLGVLFGVRLYLSKKEITSRQDIAVTQKAMRDAAQNFSLEYHEHGAPRYRPLFESTELAQREEDRDSALRTPQEGEDEGYFIRGKMEGQFIECFVQEAELDLGMGTVRKSYIAAETDAELVFFDIKFFVTPRSQKKGIAGFIHRISQNPFAGAVDFKQLRTESQTFNYAYAIWVRRYDSQDEEMVLKILTPEFIKMTLEYKEPIYIEVAYDKIRMYHDIHNITAKKIESMFKLLAHMKNTITQHQSLNN
ncbi:MAG: hypothetical protein NUV49_01530 [Patescibacteria group bacterium]|nr:hypothetical protein [Patescibacteria group bacterium]